MKRAISGAIALVVMVAGMAQADMATEQKKIAVSANSSTYFLVDLSKAQWQNIGVQLVGPINQGIGTLSGTSLSLLFAPTNVKPTDAELSGATIFEGYDWRIAFSALDVSAGETRYVWPVSIGPAQYAVGKATAGVTDIQATLQLTGRDGGGWAPAKPIRLSEQQSAFTTTGITPYYSGTTSIPVAEGCQYVEVQPVGDAVTFTTDGTAPTSTSRRIAANSVWTLTRAEWQRFTMRPAGAAAGALNIVQWTAKP